MASFLSLRRMMSRRFCAGHASPPGGRAVEQYARGGLILAERVLPRHAGEIRLVLPVKYPIVRGLGGQDEWAVGKGISVERNVRLEQRFRAGL